MLSGLQNLTLNVIKMEGYKRGILWSDTNLPWISPSPNIVDLDTAILYHSFFRFMHILAIILFHLTLMSHILELASLKRSIQLQREEARSCPSNLLVGIGLILLCQYNNSSLIICQVCEIIILFRHVLELINSYNNRRCQLYTDRVCSSEYLSTCAFRWNITLISK